MNRLKIAAAALNQTPLDWEGNQRRIVEAVEKARRDNVSILVLPELCISGYGCEDQFLSPGLQRTALAVLKEILPSTQGIVVTLGLPLFFGKALFDTACLVADGEILGFAAKRFLAGDGIHYEPRWFKPWVAGKRAEIELDGQRYPIGDLLFDLGDVKLGFEICEDAWAASRPGIKLAERGVDLILNPSASHFAFGKYEVRKRFVIEGSRAFGVAYVYANLLGNEAGRAIYDGCTLIASAGDLLACGARFSYEEVVLTSAVIDLDIIGLARTRLSGLDSVEEVKADGCIAAQFAFPALSPACAVSLAESWETGANIKEEEFSRAVCLGLFDYLRKSGAEGYVVSLSGGADSSAVSCLVALMVRFAASELGIDLLKAKLGYIRSLEHADSAADIVFELLTCVYQSTKNSSSVTRHAAQAVAESLNARFLCFDIDPIVAEYTDMVVNGLKRETSWGEDDIALQNIQARVRGPSVWFIANLRRALLLATSNRSEAAVGYTTMDGDSCGGLSPIAGIDKAFLRRWLKWLETCGPAGYAPMPALALVTSQAPTAELRPIELHQTDEDDLMPYELLDEIERLAIRDKKAPIEIYEILSSRSSPYSSSQLVLWIERFFTLWCRNQWKRERYAPSFHLDDENLDPKTWCRFPVLSGGFARELAELRQFVDQGYLRR